METGEKEDAVTEITPSLLADLNLEKYINYLFTHKAKTPVDESDKAKCWKAPTENDKLFFPIWRGDSFDKEVDFYNYRTEGCPLPLNIIIQKETDRIVVDLNQFYTPIIDDLINGWLMEYYYEMACLMGKIDYLKYLKNLLIESQRIEDNSTELGKKSDSGFEFQDFLEERGKSILPQLRAFYKKKKSKVLTLMVLAIVKAGIARDEIYSNKAALNRMLTKVFGYPGSVTALKENFKNFSYPSLDQEKEIVTHTRKIEEFLQNVSTDTLRN